MAESELLCFVRPGTYSHDDRGDGGRPQAPEPVANRNLPRLVQLFLNILRESGFREVETEHDPSLPLALQKDGPPEELEANEFYLDITDIPTKEVHYGESEQRVFIREYVVLFARGSVAFNAGGKLLSVE